MTPEQIRTPGGFSSLEAVATLFSNPWALLAGWIHYLAFDLLTLILTFLFGPAGWLLYIVVRSTRQLPRDRVHVEG